MKLKLSSAAVLVMYAVAAHAQSSVTLYGIIDTGLMYQSANAANFQSKLNLGHSYQLRDAGIYTSLWGMLGHEDLGGGYQANFRLEGGFASNNGTLRPSDTPGVSAVFNRQSTVGISSPYGSIDLGRQLTPLIYAVKDTDVRGAEYFGSGLTALLGFSQAAGWPGTSTNGALGAIYDSNAIVYRSPKFHGASLALEYAPGGVAGQFQGGTRESAVLQYANYGLNLAAAYYNGHDTNPFGPTGQVTPATGLNNNQLYYLGALYRIQGFSVHASYSRARNPAHASQTDLEMFSAGLGYRLTPSFEITSGYYYLHDRNNGSNHSAEFAAGATYLLSKLTLVYAEVGYVDNRGTMSQIIAYGTPVPEGHSTTAAMVGIRHTF
jgi:predicted porin